MSLRVHDRAPEYGSSFCSAILESVCSHAGHLSLAPSWAPPGVFLRHDDGGLYASQIEDGGDALDATFRLVPGLSSTNGYASSQFGNYCQMLSGRSPEGARTARPVTG